MKPSSKWLVISIICIILGAALMLISGVRGGGDLTDLLERTGRVEKTEEKTVTVTEEFRSVYVQDLSADVRILPSRDGSCRVIYGESEHVSYQVSVEENTLKVIRSDKAGGGPYFSRESIPVQIYLPRGSYDKLQLETSSGDVRLETDSTWRDTQIRALSGDVELRDFRAGTLHIETSSGEIGLDTVQAERLELESISGDQTIRQTLCSGEAMLSFTSGEIEIEDSRAGSLSISGMSGEVTLSRTACSGELRAETSSGEIRLRDASAGSYDLRTTSGDVSGSVLGSTDFIPDTLSGSVRTRGGVRGAAPCRVSTSSGDIDLEAGN